MADFQHDHQAHRAFPHRSDPAYLAFSVIGVALGLLIIVALLLPVVLPGAGGSNSTPAVPGRKSADVLLTEHRTSAERALGGYAWIDRDAGLVRIPIDRAIDLLIAERATTETTTVTPLESTP